MRKWCHCVLHNGGVVLYTGVDSSPHAGINYEMFQAFIVERCHSAHLHDVITLLRIMKLLSPNEWENNFEEEQMLMKEIQGHVRHVIFPVVIMVRANLTSGGQPSSTRCGCFLSTLRTRQRWYVHLVIG